MVWVAGGLAKGARFDDLVRDVRGRLRGAVLLGRDRAVIAEALSRHAPDVPVVEVGDGETGHGHDPMERVVEAAARLARPGDTVLLAPGCASMDMFANYGARGDAFAAAVRRRTGGPTAPGDEEARCDDDHRRPPIDAETGRHRRPRSARRLVLSWYAALRSALDRPLTSYYLLLGASALLLTIGLIMVLSASSVYSFEHHDGDSYAVVKRQLMWVVLGIPCRLAGLPAALPADPPGLVARHHGRGRAAGADPDRPRHRRQRQHQLAGARAVADPAVGDRQALDRAVGRRTSTPRRTGGSAGCTRS